MSRSIKEVLIEVSRIQDENEKVLVLKDYLAHEMLLYSMPLQNSMKKPENAVLVGDTIIGFFEKLFKDCK